jgi:hypothetical protein
MGFKEAVENTKGLKRAYRPGLQALKRRDKNHVTCRGPYRVSGSMDLDGALATVLPNDPRWDYGVAVVSRGQSETIVWIEIHSADSHHVDEVLRKYNWLRSWLPSAPRLKTMSGDRLKCFWVASGPIALQRHHPQLRKLEDQGVRFAGSHLCLSDPVMYSSFRHQ